MYFIWREFNFFCSSVSLLFLNSFLSKVNEFILFGANIELSNNLFLLFLSESGDVCTSFFSLFSVSSSFILCNSFFGLSDFDSLVFNKLDTFFSDKSLLIFFWRFSFLFPFISVKIILFIFWFILSNLLKLKNLSSKLTVRFLRNNRVILALFWVFTSLLVLILLFLNSKLLVLFLEVLEVGANLLKSS